MLLLFLLSSFHLRTCYSSRSMQPLCHDDESHALLQLKESLVINESASSDPSAYPKLQKPGLQHLVEALTNLEVLHLRAVNISAKLPESIGNRKSLKEFDVRDCHFSGVVPSSLGNLTKLSYLDLSHNSFYGKIPSTFVNLLQVSHLSLSNNNFSSGTLDWLGNLTKLKYVGLIETNSYGNIPSSLRNLTQLTVLRLHGNKLTGQIPPWIGNHTQLISLLLGDNELHGAIPESIYRLQNLEDLDLAFNSFSGSLELHLLLKFRNLVSLQLSYNHLSLLYSHNATIPQPKLELLTLSRCNLVELPSFLRDQNHLEYLELKDNELVLSNPWTYFHGTI
ncbi:hypothetical protein POTOM_051990 [Populus tomentosa]|uniref:Disease resistance R13L4/SHOC-2-like LRR domain-containing protein n=1 Tax=Populus tomentosa TaxID=118781 RepID=A0A8X7Y834_POPTO|nr:hypothetical protein POTOM_051990 [Populus tomentosa]